MFSARTLYDLPSAFHAQVGGASIERAVVGNLIVHATTTTRSRIRVDGLGGTYALVQSEGRPFPVLANRRTKTDPENTFPLLAAFKLCCTCSRVQLCTHTRGPGAIVSAPFALPLRFRTLIIQLVASTSLCPKFRPPLPLPQTLRPFLQLL